MQRLALTLALAGGLLAADKLMFVMDPALHKQMAENMRTAAQDGNFANVLVQGRRSLELYPNDPVLQAPIYLIMSEAAQKSGDAAQAAELGAIARKLDPSLAARLDKAQVGTATRGDKAEKFQMALAMFAQGVQTYQTMRMQQQQMRMQQQPQQQMQQQMPPQQYMPQQGGNVNYPAAPVGDPNYQPNPAANAPMPGWAPAPQQQMQYGQPQYAQPAQPQYPQQQQQYPQQQQYQQQPQYAQPAQPQYQPQPQQQPQYAYPPVSSPYAAQNYVPQGVPTRGAKAQVFKVVHDHSQTGDRAYFEKSCGALLSVSGSNLTFTATGGEAPRVIPAADIREIRLNQAIGKDAGAFHIATKQGLYLNLAPASASREDARATIDALRTQLGLGE